MSNKSMSVSASALAAYPNGIVVPEGGEGCLTEIGNLGLYHES